MEYSYLWERFVPVHCDFDSDWDRAEVKCYFLAEKSLVLQASRSYIVINQGPLFYFDQGQETVVHDNKNCIDLK